MLLGGCSRYMYSANDTLFSLLLGFIWTNNNYLHVKCYQTI
jgi:hypothetical protein